MTTKQYILGAAALVATIFARGADAPKPPCCAEAEKPACCVETDATTRLLGALPTLSARSIYQLEATWTDDAGKKVRLATLRGQPVILAMFFAQCEYACPMIVADMQRMREALPADVRAKAKLVLVSFDTARDTPAALKAYRENRKLDDAWSLLRGDTNSVQELAMLLGVKFKQDARGQFSHSNTITILNDAGEITHQRNGLMGDVSEAARAVVLAAK